MDRMIIEGMKRGTQDKEITRLLNVLSDDSALKHLRSILIENLSILESRHKLYNGEQTVLDNCYTDMDATALQNAQQAFVRTKGQCKKNGSMLRDVPLNDLEGKGLIQDTTDWFLIWQCCRREVKGYPAMDDIEMKGIEKRNELSMLGNKNNTNGDGSTAVPTLPNG